MRDALAELAARRLHQQQPAPHAQPVGSVVVGVRSVEGEGGGTAVPKMGCGVNAPVEALGGVVDAVGTTT